MNAKIFFEGQIRRTTLESSPTFDSLKQKLAKLFNEPAIEDSSRSCIKYSDEDGDWIDMSSDEELIDAIKWVRSFHQVIKLQISLKPEEKKEIPREKPQENREIPQEKVENPIKMATDFFEQVASSEQMKPVIQQLESLTQQFLGGNPPSVEGILTAFDKFLNIEVKEEKMEEAQEEEKVEREEKMEEEKKEEEKEEQKQVEKPVHFAVCDSCRKRIVGVRHKCNDCADYDLCEVCIEEKSTVHPSHSFRAIERPECPFQISKPVQALHHATCDSCQDRIVGLRFKCLSCPDYDLCGHCFQSQEEIHPDHDFFVIEKPGCCTRPCGNVEKKAEPAPASLNPFDVTLPELEDSDSESDDEEFHESVEEPQQMEEEKSAPAPAPAPVELRDSQIQPGMTREKLQEGLKQLQEMGFTDRESNVKLIIQNQGDIVTTILQLLQQA